MSQNSHARNTGNTSISYAQNSQPGGGAYANTKSLSNSTSTVGAGKNRSRVKPQGDSQFIQQRPAYDPDTNANSMLDEIGENFETSKSKSREVLRSKELSREKFQSLQQQTVQMVSNSTKNLEPKNNQ